MSRTRRALYQGRAAMRLSGLARACPAPRALFAVCGLVVVLGTAGGSSESDPARAFLASTFSLAVSDFAEIDRGKVVARTLDAADKREVATVGVVRVRITPDFYVQQLRDIANLKRDEAILQIGTFGNPPELSDVTALTLEESDIRSLRACRVGDCGVQLSAEAITRFRQDVDWRRADAADRANALMRQILVEYVARYVSAGGTASMEYADRSDRINVGREFTALAGSGTGAWKHFPQLRQHLFDYPEADTPGTTDLLYWSKERVGRRAVASITHLAISRTVGPPSVDYAVASKQIYGSHYYDASLGLTILLRDGSGPSPATYVAYVNRSRVDVFGGLFGGLARSLVSSKAKGTVSDQLARLRTVLEQRFASLPTP